MTALYRATTRPPALPGSYTTPLDATQRNAPCWLCGGMIDYRAKRYEPNSFEADHAYPVSTHPQFAYDPSRLRASHSRCNRARRAEEITHGEWVRPTW